MSMITRKICPNCNEVNTAVAVAGGIVGSYVCSACGYTGSFIEEEIMQSEEEMKYSKLIKKDLEEMKEKQRSRRGNKK